MMTDIMQINDVVKRYPNGKFTLGPIRLSIKRDDCLALFGKNGAGKSSLFQAITGNLDPTDGEIRLDDEILLPESFLLKRRIGYLPQNIGMPMWVTPTEILTYAANLHQLNDPSIVIDKALRYWDCLDFAHKPIAACSHGMQKRVGLALATLHDPALLILDEPFSGLDIFHIRALETLIAERRNRHKATILSTHVAFYAARYCNRGLVLEAGSMQEFGDWKDDSEISRIKKVESFFFGQEPVV